MATVWLKRFAVAGVVVCLALSWIGRDAGAATLDPGKKQISDWVDSNKEKIIRLSDVIWSYAELGMQEHRSLKVVTDYLKAEGFKVETGVAGMPTAFSASWGSGKPAI